MIAIRAGHKIKLNWKSRNKIVLNIFVLWNCDAVPYLEIVLNLDGYDDQNE